MDPPTERWKRRLSTQVVYKLMRLKTIVCCCLSREYAFFKNGKVTVGHVQLGASKNGWVFALQSSKPTGPL